MKFEAKLVATPLFIYNSRNLLMKFELQVSKYTIQSTTVEIY